MTFQVWKNCGYLGITSWQAHTGLTTKKLLPSSSWKNSSMSRYLGVTDSMIVLNQNMLSRIQISLAKAMNESFYLPDYLVIILENDLIDYLDFKGQGVSTMYGLWAQWLCNTIELMIKQWFESIPGSARKQTQVYWVLPLYHKNLSYEEKQAREKFNHCFEVVVKLHDCMRTIKFKEIWDQQDNELVVNDKLTHSGLSRYWRALDASLEFNYNKRKDFLIWDNFRQLQKATDSADTTGDLRQVVKRRRFTCDHDPEVPDGTTDHTNDGMQEFFHRNRRVNRYHWHKNSCKLPKPKNFT